MGRFSGAAAPVSVSPRQADVQTVEGKPETKSQRVCLNFAFGAIVLGRGVIIVAAGVKS